MSKINYSEIRLMALYAKDIAPRGELYDIGGALVMPGLINTHTHSHSSIFRSLADDLELMDWLKKAIWPMEKRLSHARMYAATSLSCLEFLTSGITTIADQIYYSDTVAKATSKSGIRSFLASSVFSGNGPAPDLEDSFAQAVEFVNTWLGSEKETRIYPCIGPHAPYSVEEDLFRDVIDFAEKKDLMIHVHISETMDENRDIFQRTGKTPTALLSDYGVFSRPTLAAHSIHLDEDDIALYSKHDVAASYNPMSNLKLVSGIMPIESLWKEGVTVSIGTDGAQSNNSLDLLSDLRTGALIQKQWMGDATFFSARDAVRMATIEGAKSLRFDDEIGSLEVGKRADIIVFDSQSTRLAPMHITNLENLYSLVAYSASGSDVKDVIIDGEWIVRDRKALKLDKMQMIADAQEASEYLLKG